MFPRMNREGFDTLWPRIRSTLEAILSEANLPRVTWNNTFSDIYLLSERVGTEVLYTETKKFLIEYLARVALRISTFQKSDMVLCYCCEWLKYSEACKHLNDLYLYNERGPFPLEYKKPSVNKVTLEAWRISVIEKLGDKVVELVVQDSKQAKREVSGDQITVVTNSLVEVHKSMTIPEKEEDALSAYIHLICESYNEVVGDRLTEPPPKLM